MFSKQQYIEYLIATIGNYTCTNLADHLEGAQTVSHDTICDFLGQAKLTPSGLWHTVQTMIHDGPKSYLIFDDSVQDKKYAKKIELVYRQYSGAEHGVVAGIGVVNLVHTDGSEHGFYPIDYRIFDPNGDGKTKHDHFREMLINAVADKGIKAKTVLFDNWYASMDNLKLINRLNLFFITTVQSNRKVSISPEAGYVNLEDLPWGQNTYDSGIWVKLKGLPFKVRLFVVVSKNGDIDWVITNRPRIPSTR